MALDPELEKKIRRIQNGGNMLKMLAKGLIATRGPQGSAVAIKEEMDKSDEQAKEYTDRSMDILDKVAVPKIIERRRMLAREKQYVSMLKDTYDVDENAIKAVSAGGFGQLEGFVKYIEGLNEARGDKGNLTGDQINTLVKNADEYKQFKSKDGKELTAMQFLDSKFDFTKNLIKENPDHVDAALFSSIVGTPRQKSQGQLQNVEIFDGMNAFDLVRYSKAGLLEDTSNYVADTPFVRDLEQQERFTSGNYLERTSAPAKDIVYSELNYKGISNQEKFNKNNRLFQLLLMQNGIKNNVEYNVDGSSKVPVDNVLAEKYVEATNQYDSYFDANKIATTAEAKQIGALDIARDIVSKFKPKSEEELIEFIKMLDPDNSGRIFKDYDEFEILNPSTNASTLIKYADIKGRIF